jgi:hypothetical protein
MASTCSFTCPHKIHQSTHNLTDFHYGNTYNFYTHIFYGTSTSGCIKFCGESSVPPLGHIGPQPSDPRPDKVGTEPKPPTYILRRHLSFCLLVRRFRTRVLPSSLTFLYNFSSACKHEVFRFLDKLRLTS